MADINKPVTNPNLLEAMKMVANNNTVTNRDVLINEVLKANFLSPVIINQRAKSEASDGKITLKENTSISFVMLNNDENKSFYMAFTDWSELRKWQSVENQQTLVVTFDDYASLVNKSHAAGFVINPFGDNVIFSCELISHISSEVKKRESMGRGMVEQIIEKETQIMLGQPNAYPDALVKAISANMAKISSVKTVYLFLMIKKDNNEQNYLIAIDFEGDKRQIFDSVGKSAIPYLNGFYLDIVSADTDFVADSIKNTKPFYKKKKFVLF